MESDTRPITAAGHSAQALAQFEFGLTDSQEEHARRLHRSSIVFDMLCAYGGSNIFTHYSNELRAELDARLKAAPNRKELVTEAICWPFEMSRLGRSNLLSEWLLAGGLTCGSFSIEDFAHDRCDPLSCEWEVKVRRYAQLDWLRYATTAAEIRQSKLDGTVAMYANFQPVDPVPRDLKAFETAHRKGLRSFMLTYNRMDNIGTGCTERVDAGLSMFGIEVVKHCNDIGMIVDVSHCGHLTTMDACRHSKEPITANHTSARSLCDHARGKSDEELRAIADTGGVIGVLAVPHFLSDAASPSIEHMLDHIDYIASIAGWRHVAIGTDWPWPVPDEVLSIALGPEYDSSIGFRATDRVDRTKRLCGFEDCRDLPNITRGLVKRGYSDEQIRAILGENALRVFQQVCG